VNRTKRSVKPVSPSHFSFTPAEAIKFQTRYRLIRARGVPRPSCSLPRPLLLRAAWENGRRWMFDEGSRRRANAGRQRDLQAATRIYRVGIAPISGPSGNFQKSRGQVQVRALSRSRHSAHSPCRPPPSAVLPASTCARAKVASSTRGLRLRNLYLPNSPTMLANFRASLYRSPPQEFVTRSQDVRFIADRPGWKGGWEGGREGGRENALVHLGVGRAGISVLHRS